MLINCKYLNKFIIEYLKQGTGLRWESTYVLTDDQYCVSFWTPDIGLFWESISEDLENLRTVIFEKGSCTPKHIDAITFYTVDSEEQKNIDFESLSKYNKKTVISEVLTELMEFMMRNNGNIPTDEQLNEIYATDDKRANKFFELIKIIHMCQEKFLSNTYDKQSFQYKKQQKLIDSIELRNSLYNEGYSTYELLSSLNKS